MVIVRRVIIRRVTVDVVVARVVVVCPHVVGFAAVVHRHHLIVLVGRRALPIHR